MVSPVYNEERGILQFYDSLHAVLRKSFGEGFEMIFVDDGSTDKTPAILGGIARKNKLVRFVCLSRNFGKENALSAGIAHAQGKAILLIDSDGQHPVEYIPRFISAWQDGAKVVVGIRDTKHAGAFKKLASELFYHALNFFSDQKTVPGSTDFRLIDSSVREAFLELRESDRVTRELIDWLGFERAYIHYQENPRKHGQPTYTFRKLLHLALNNIIASGSGLLNLILYFGLTTATLSFLLGIAVFLQQIVLGDPLNWNFTGTAMLGIMTVFLVSILLVAIGTLAMFIGNIYNQSRGRPLYVVDHEKCVNTTDS